MTPLDVVMECLSLREQRVSTDLVRDEVEEELHKVIRRGQTITQSFHLSGACVRVLCRPLTIDYFS